MIVKTVVKILRADPAVTARVEQRIYPRKLPDAATFPAIVVLKAAGVGSYVLAGDAGLERARVQIDVYADSYDEMLETKLAVRRKLSGFSGGAPGGSPCSIDTSKCIVDEDLDVPETVRSGPRLCRRLLEFDIWNREV